MTTTSKTTHRKGQQQKPLQKQAYSVAASATEASVVARVAVIGSGRMGHIRSNIIRSNPKLELVGIVDNVMEGAQKLAQMYRVKPFSSLEELVADQKHNSSEKNSNDGAAALDAIVCCSPTATHREVIQQAAQYGLHVFCEKPVDVSAPKIRSLFEIAQKANIHLCCGFQRRFDPSYQSAMENIASIGTPIYANIFFGDHPVPPMEFLKQGGDIFMDLSAHDVDYVLQLLPGQQAISVYATGTSSTPELEQAGVHDNACMVMKFDKGTVVNLFMSRSASYGYDQRAEIFGSEGRIQVGNIHATSTVISTSSGHHQSKYQHSFPQRFHQAFGMELNAFADTLLFQAPWPVTEYDCLRVQTIADAAQRSAATGQVVSIPPIDTPSSLRNNKVS